MNIEENDPRLTAYALGELDAEERTALEAALKNDATARGEVEEISSLANRLKDELASAPTPKAVNRAAIEAARQPSNVTPIKTKSPLRFVRFFGAAALVCSAAAALFMLTTAQRSEDAAAPPPVEVAAQAHKYETVELPAAAPAREEGKMKIDRSRGGDLVHNTESYDHFAENPFIRVATDPRSTFSIDVDTASYSIVRRHLNEHRLPPAGAVRIEEMVNYFSYAYPEPEGERPFSVNAEVAKAPWAPDHKLVKIGLKGKEVARANAGPSNLVFLLDVSGSMEAADKLPLLKRGLSLLVDQLSESDHVSIVVYAGASGVVLEPTSGSNKASIMNALDRLDAGGSTNGGEGIQLAYQMARKHFSSGGVNRVILATDGDFNVGVSDQSELTRLIEKEATSGVFLSVLGFGSGNYKDSTLEKLADHGNGNYAYIDSLSEARKVLVEQGTGTLITIAKDVKIQVEFNPGTVEAFRLIGYENRVLAHQDFNNDKKDAGDIGAGHTVTALYEVIPKGGRVPAGDVDGLKYQAPLAPTPAAGSGELMTIKLRYKQPTASDSQLLTYTLKDGSSPSSTDMSFAAAVASFGMLLRDSPHRGSASYASVKSLASAGLQGPDQERRREFLQLVGLAERAAAAQRPSGGR